VTRESHEGLLAFVRQLPVGPAYAPIYAKGQVFGKHQDVSSGKAPYERSHHVKMSPADVALLIEQRPEVFKAVGLFTGIRSEGLVILDVDSNLTALRRRWGESLDGAPMIKSTKRNAAKFVFRVPEDQRAKVKGISGKVTGAGYEVLYGMQGIIAGEYPGSSDGTAPTGSYSLVAGSLDEIPEAPDWLLAEMRAAKSADAPAEGFVKNRKGLDFSGRTEDEVAELVRDCLAVLPHLGRGTEDFWWSVGAMVAEALPNEKGLVLWSAWSAEDPAFEDDWVNGDPCAAKWPHILSRVGRPNNKGLGSLIHLADEYDPARERFQESSRKTLTEVESQKVQKVEQVYLSGAELLERAKKIEEEIDNPALQDQAKHVLALQAGRREGSVAVDRLLLMDMLYGDASGMEPVAVDEMSDDGIDEYLIPGLLPKGWMLLLHADGGTGKTAACQLLVKHLTQAIPFDVFGETVPVEKCRALWLNGDQNPKILKKQLERIGVEKGVDVVGEWDLAWYSRFCRMQKEKQYDIVVIDSLDGCNDSNPYEENRREYAKPLKRLQKRNGRDFPLCTFIVIHHNSKTGAFRGTTAIKACVDETWNMQELPQDELMQRGLRPSTRLITIGKSRNGREKLQMVFTLNKDFTYSINYLPPKIEFPTPQQYVVDVLRVMRKDPSKAWCRADLDACQELDGGPRSNRYALEELASQHLIVEVDRRSRGRGKPAVYYCAVVESIRARGGRQEESRHLGKTLGTTEKQNGSKWQNPEGSPLSEEVQEVVRTTPAPAAETPEVTVLDHGAVASALIESAGRLLRKEPPSVVDVVARATEVWD
jgi:hypothetical protein